MEGLKRRGFSTEAIKAIRDAYKVLYRSSLSLKEARERLGELAKEFPIITQMYDFLCSTSGRSIIR